MEFSSCGCLSVGVFNIWRFGFGVLHRQDNRAELVIQISIGSLIAIIACLKRSFVIIVCIFQIMKVER